MGDEIGGHHVSGHVHTTALLRDADQIDANNRRLTFQACRCPAVSGMLHRPTLI